MSNNDNQDYYSSNAFSFLKKTSHNYQVNDLNYESGSSDNIKFELLDNKDYKIKIPKNAQFLNQTNSAYEKNIKDSHKAIYEQPIPTFDGYLTKGNLI